MIGKMVGQAMAKAQQTAQSQAAVQGTLAGLTITTNSAVSPGHIWLGGNATLARTPIKDFTDEEILEEYLKRFSPLAQAMKEEK